MEMYDLASIQHRLQNGHRKGSYVMVDSTGWGKTPTVVSGVRTIEDLRQGEVPFFCATVCLLVGSRGELENV